MLYTYYFIIYVIPPNKARHWSPQKLYSSTNPFSINEGTCRSHPIDIVFCQILTFSPASVRNDANIVLPWFQISYLYQIVNVNYMTAAWSKINHTVYMCFISNNHFVYIFKGISIHIQTPGMYIKMHLVLKWYTFTSQQPHQTILRFGFHLQPGNGILGLL